RRAAESERVADREHRVTDLQGRRVGQRHDGQPRDAVDVDDRDVIGWVDAQNLCGVRAGTALDDDTDRDGPFNHVVVREHVAGGDDDGGDDRSREAGRVPTTMDRGRDPNRYGGGGREEVVRTRRRVYRAGNPWIHL